MPLYDRVKDLALTVERVELEPHVLPLKHMTRRTTVFHLHGGGPRGRRRGRDLRGAAPSRPVEPAGPDGRAHARDLLRARRRPARLPPVGPRVRRSRPRSPPGRAVARRGGRRASRSPFASSSRRARSRSCARCIRRSGSSSTRATSGRTTSSPSSLRRRPSTSSTSRACTRAIGSTRRRRRSSTAASQRPSPRRGSRTRG